MVAKTGLTAFRADGESQLVRPIAADLHNNENHNYGSTVGQNLFNYLTLPFSDSSAEVRTRGALLFLSISFQVKLMRICLVS